MLGTNSKPKGKAKVCLNCGAPPTGKPLVCASCRTVAYCSRGCQKAHWKAHKAACRRIRINSDAVGAAVAAAEASNRAASAGDHRNLGFATVPDEDMLASIPGIFSLGWLIDRQDRRLKHVHGSRWIEVVRSTIGSKAA